jgi:hypothetical protein
VKKIASDVARELGRFGPAAGMVRIVEAWPAAVGPTIARNAWPARIARDGTLHVATSSASWAFELAQLEPDVIQRLRSATGKDAPAKLRFAVGKLPELGLEDDERGERTPVKPGPEQLRKAAELAASIDDEELREAVAKAAAQSLLRAAMTARSDIL